MPTIEELVQIGSRRKGRGGEVMFGGGEVILILGRGEVIFIRVGEKTFFRLGCGNI